MGDATVEVTEENRDASQEAKMQAMEAISEGTLLLWTLSFWQVLLITLCHSNFFFLLNRQT